MRPLNIMLLNTLIALGLILPGALVTSPLAIGPVAAQTAAPDARAKQSDGPLLEGRRAQRKADRRDERRQELDRERKQSRAKADRTQNPKPKDRKQDRKQKDKDTSPKRRGAGEGSERDTEDRYIVVLERSTGNPTGVANAVLAESSDVTITQVYDNVLDGFAATIPPDQLDEVRNDPRVQAVVPDQEVRLDGQTLPTGINRVEADQNPTSKIDGRDDGIDVDVAVLDTGIAAHPDLNVVGGISCVAGESGYADGHGHGTHVAGTIGALDNDTGVVGAAPGARLWAVKVINAEGRGLFSEVICGLDWVTANRGTIEVVNMSLGGVGSDSSCSANNDPLHNAICRVVNAGIPVVVSAGNDSKNAAEQIPAAYDEVITVSALADSDGLPGGLGAAMRAGPDDSRANFSNFGADVDIAAPGASILSTIPGGYGYLSGTSMASPLVAGAAALYLVDNPSANPTQVRAALLRTRETVAGINEGVLDVSDGFGSPPPTVNPAPQDPPPTTTNTDNNDKKDKKKKKKGKPKRKKRR